MRLLVLAVLTSASVAHADGTLPDGSTLKWNRLFLHEGNSTDLVQPAKTPDSLWHYFNLAHCVCAQTGAATNTDYKEQTFAYELLLQGAVTPLHRPLEIWVGASCDDTIMRPMNCHKIDSAGIADIGSIATTNGVTPELSVFDLMTPEPMNEGCEQRVLSANEWAIADTDGDGTPDYFLSQSVDTDSLPPPLPTTFTASGAENGIEISWTAATGDVADIAYYQALCATDLGDPGRTDPPAPRYVTPRLLCGAALDAKLAPSDITTATPADGDAGTDGDAGEIALPMGLSQLDPAYICGESADATATSLRLENLKNGVPYTVVLLAIDKFGNSQGTYFTSKLTPQPVTDFWEDLQNHGSKVEGGFCLIAETYGDGNPLTNVLRNFRDHTLADTAFGRWLTDVYYATLGKLGAVVHGHLVLRVVSGILLLPLVVVALLWHALTLPGLLVLVSLFVLRRRIMRSRMAQRAAAVATLLVVLLASTHAHAQSPYWEDQTGLDADHSLADEVGEVKWHAGVRVGPYTPQIDAQNGMTNSAGQGPYKAMFGGYSIMPMLDVDRFLWTGVGQLGFGLSVGYMGKTAHAFVDGSDPNDPNRARSPGDTTSFRLIPIQLTAVYRFSWLDDEYGIPLVPYARAGLGYYVWWSSAPSGSSSVDPMDPNNKARGASAGLVGSIGLQIRAERIDAEAARSMAQSGLQHAGFYGELNLGWVDGFGKATKLDVGDTTWFAGVDFEF